MAAAYARLLPQQSFLMVATRNSGRQFSPPANVELQNLAGYATANPPQAEITSLLERWTKLGTDMCSVPELEVLSRTGTLDPFSDWIRDGLSIRNAWREVLEREPQIELPSCSWHLRLRGLCIDC